MTGNVSSLAAEAARLLRTGPVTDAIAAYRRLVEARPDATDAWFDLGHLLTRDRQFEPALAAYGEALARGVAAAEEVHVNRAVILDRLERQADAEAELRAALALRPDFVPALMNLGTMAEDRGARDEARDLYERVLAIRPGDTLALARLAGMSRVSDCRDPLIGRLTDALSAEGLTDIDRATLGFALGQTLDAAGDYKRAFSAFSEANNANRRAGGARYDPATHEAMVDRLIAAFPAASPPPVGPADSAPVFICGMFRSGSTLTERILSGHSQVTAGGELDLVPAMARQLQPYPEAAAAAEAGRLLKLRDEYLSSLATLHPDARLITDKRPDNFFHLGLIKKLFPAARIVHTRREPRDNIFSIFALHLHPRMAYANDLADIAHWYVQYRRLIKHWQRLYGQDIHDVDYDQLVTQPRAVVAELLAFLGLPWEAGCLDFAGAQGVVKTASVWQVREPLYSRSSGRWRHYERDLGPAISILDTAAHEAGECPL